MRREPEASSEAKIEVEKTMEKIMTMRDICPMISILTYPVRVLHISLSPNQPWSEAGISFIMSAKASLIGGKSWTRSMFDTVMAMNQRSKERRFSKIVLRKMFLSMVVLVIFHKRILERAGFDGDVGDLVFSEDFEKGFEVARESEGQDAVA